MIEIYCYYGVSVGSIIETKPTLDEAVQWCLDRGFINTPDAYVDPETGNKYTFKLTKH